MDNKRFDELEAKLEIYKSTLTEIYERYDQKLEELSLVRRVGDALRSTMTVESLASALMVSVAHEVSADRLSLILNDNGRSERGGLKVRAAYWADREDFKFFEESQGAPFDWQSLGLLPGESENYRLRTIEEAHWSCDPLGHEGDGPRTLLLAPFMVRGRFLGLLILSRPAVSPFSPENEHMLSIMADQAGAALSNVQLFDDLSRINQKLIASEKRARESSEYLERLLETANDAIFTLDCQGRITYSNRKARQWGWSKEELLGREFRGFLEETLSLAQWAPGSPPPADKIIEATLLNAAGERRAVLISTSSVGFKGRGDKSGQDDLSDSNQVEPDQDLQGEALESWMLVVSDLTERRQLERQLLHSEKLASIGLLAAGVAHEVGNPLSAISGYAQILGAGVEDDGERREYLTAILNQTERIQKILRELLDYSRPSKGLSETLDLAQHVPKIMGMLEGQRTFGRIKVVYRLDLENGPHLVNMDRDHLAQVIVIIAMNAAQAMSEQTEPPPVFTIELNREAVYVLMILSDNGPGMSNEVIKRAFDPFFTTKAPGQGTGLGLAICQRIVDSYRGRLELKSLEGRGARFTIRWPEGGNN
ncbi:MAG: PAS domain S-box protein [Deltaproteobacteria bacterium]|jgi:PAS domain S-box-containing protein|nr:PAS domain S-box protein [Deltaproteobacteria bacterium]